MFLNKLLGLPDAISPATTVKGFGLPPTFLRLAFQATNPALYRHDTYEPETAASEIVRRTIRRFGINAAPDADDRRWYRVNKAGAAVIFTEAASPRGQTALLIMTQALNPPEQPHLESQDYVPVYTFEGVHGGSELLCTSIWYETAEIPKNSDFTPDKRTTQKLRGFPSEFMFGAAMGRKYFSQFMAGNRLRPERAIPVVEGMTTSRLLQSYGEMTEVAAQQTILQQAERMPS